MNTNDNINIDEIIKLVKLCLLKGTDMYTADAIPDLPPIEKGKSISANLFLIKFPQFGLKINTPDWFIWTLDICANGNPGYIQIMYKEILENINKTRFNNEGIPEGYTIKVEDFIYCHPVIYPIIDYYPDINKKYSDLWDKQKTTRENSLASDNLCDTIDYWMEVMKKM